MHTYQFRLYAKGAVAAVVNSAVNAMTLMIVDRSDFNIWSADGWKHIVAATAVSMIVGFLIYMKQHPLPDPLKDADYIDVKREQIEQIRNT